MNNNLGKDLGRQQILMEKSKRERKRETRVRRTLSERERERETRVRRTLIYWITF